MRRGYVEIVVDSASQIRSVGVKEKRGDFWLLFIKKK